MNNTSLENRPKECFVAFIDILGFKDFVNKENGDGAQLLLIKNAITKATELLNSRKNESDNIYNFWYKEFIVKSFSDCFCFSVPLEFDSGSKDYEQNFIAFYSWLMVFYNELFKLGYLCRGGITQGWHYVDKDMIFSKGLVEAYILESKKAIYPMIMVSDILIKKIKSSNLNEKYNKLIFIHDNANRIYLNTFNYSEVSEMFFNADYDLLIEDLKKTKQEHLYLFLEIANNKIIEYKGKEYVDKYQWVKEYILFEKENKYSDKFFNGFV